VLAIPGSKQKGAMAASLARPFLYLSHAENPGGPIEPFFTGANASSKKPSGKKYEETLEISMLTAKKLQQLCLLAPSRIFPIQKQPR